MARNRVQFQKGYSVVQFMDEYGSEEKWNTRPSWTLRSRERNRSRS